MTPGRISRTMGVILMACFTLATVARAEGALTWSGWSADVLAKAQAEKRFIILDLEAVWCHWCHVMEETTYRDAKVVALIKAKYLPIRVDQDANPDLSARYGDWGWPATIIFAPDGSELVKRRGYIAPENMAALLQAVIDDPTPGPSVTKNEDVVPADTSKLSVAARQILNDNFAKAYDEKFGGWGNLHKYIDVDSMDWVLQQSERGDMTAIKMARTTLDSAKALIDPVWGGIYQYSDKDDWSSPHYEKIMWYQSNGLRQYAAAFALFKDLTYRKAADDIYRYVTTILLSPEGAFYATQDADVDRTVPGKDFYKLSDAERKKLGRQPRVDQNLYARENGWAISGLVAYANATGHADALKQAERAADWVLNNRRNADGIFKHGAKDRGGPFLGDTIAMGNASLDLYSATGARKWLNVARDAGQALAKFRDASGGFFTTMTAEAASGVLATPHKAMDEQVHATRFANRVARYLGDGKAQELSEHGMRYLASDAIIESGRATPGVLVSDGEISHEPIHITVVGHKNDIDASRLHEAARRFPALYKRVDWWDVRDGPLPNPDVTYPEMDRAAVFACSNRLCSLPAFTGEELNAAVNLMLQRPANNASR